MTTPHLALKIDVSTLRGTREGVPRLVDMLKRHGAGATFFFSLGPDHTGRVLRRLLRRGVLRKARRTSALGHYGLRTLLNGTLLPGPDIGRTCADQMRLARDAGFEIGVRAWNPVLWQDRAADGEFDWTLAEMERACERFREIFGTDPKVHGAAGWRMNRHALRLTQRLGFDYCSDMRGTHPFVPIRNAEVIACPQMPTTLPTFDEIYGLDGVNEGNVVNRQLDRTRAAPASGHVYTLRAEFEGMRLAPMLEALIEGWRDQGYRLCSLGEYFEWLPDKNLPRHDVVDGTVPGRGGRVCLQGAPFLGPLPADALIKPRIA